VHRSGVPPEPFTKWKTQSILPPLFFSVLTWCALSFEGLFSLTVPHPRFPPTPIWAANAARGLRFPFFGFLPTPSSVVARLRKKFCLRSFVLSFLLFITQLLRVRPSVPPKFSPVIGHFCISGGCPANLSPSSEFFPCWTQWWLWKVFFSNLSSAL